MHRGYISDRLLFYGIFSPKALGWKWLIFTILLFLLFLFFREKLWRLKTWQFLLAIYIFFILFAIGTAAIRDGFYGVYEPFTRTRWEYAGNLPLVENTRDFLKNYIVLAPRLAEHARTHPPGYTVVLYIFQKYLNAGLPLLAVFAIMLGGLIVFPLYYFLRNFATEEETRNGLELFVFLPSFVMFSATSMEAVFLFFSWLAISLIYEGWNGQWIFSFLGGLAVAAALFMNFLFLLLAPLFLMLAYFLGRLREVAKQSIFAAFGFLGFYSVLYYWSGYSLVQNFFSARGVQAEVVRSNFESFSIYGIFLFMSLISFVFYLGVPNIVLFAKNLKGFFVRENKSFALGFIMVALFLTIGIFQGETERIWLFLTPLFILPLIKVVGASNATKTFALLPLLFFQIIFTQIMFYTYW